MENRKMIPNKLPAEVYKALENIVGKQWISQDRAIVECYSKLSLDAEGFIKKHMKDPSSIPACVVLPGSTEEVQAIVRVANKYKVPFVPFTNGQAMSAPTGNVPTICVHVSRMNRVLNIDEENMAATLEPYADYGQLLAEAAKRGLWNGGTPLATTLAKLSSQSAFAGIWQTGLKYGLLGRNVVGYTVVLPTGDILKAGSQTVSGVENFWDCSPGPDLMGMVRASGGTMGIITQITVKLHPWVGGPDIPEPPSGRPCIPKFYEAKFDTAPPPEKHKLFWIEFPDYDSEINAYREIAHSGIGIGLNASGVYSAYYCSQTQEMTETRFREQFFPPWNLYVIIAGIVSDDQIAYDEKVLREIAEEFRGKFLSRDYKPDVLEALATWNLDWIRNVCGYRMNRRMYAGAVLPYGPPEVAKYHSKIWKETLDTYGETHITDRGGADNTTFVYAMDPAGRYTLSETDGYPDPMDPESMHTFMKVSMHASIRNAAERDVAPFAFGGPAEPLTTFFPEQGPNAYLLFRKFRKVFDPNGISSPGRQVFTEEEYKAFSDQKFEQINAMRKLFGLKLVKR
jgi:hypothetical protein